MMYEKRFEARRLDGRPVLTAAVMRQDTVQNVNAKRAREVGDRVHRTFDTPRAEINVSHHGSFHSVLVAGFLAEFLGLATVVEQDRGHDNIAIDFRIGGQQPVGRGNERERMFEEAASIRVMKTRGGGRHEKALIKRFVAEYGTGELPHEVVLERADHVREFTLHVFERPFARAFEQAVIHFVFRTPAQTLYDQLQLAVEDLHDSVDPDDVSGVESLAVLGNDVVRAAVLSEYFGIDATGTIHEIEIEVRVAAPGGAHDLAYNAIVLENLVAFRERLDELAIMYPGCCCHSGRSIVARRNGGQPIAGMASLRRLTVRGEPGTLFGVMRKRRTILAVFAHPDDEAYGPGGTLAHYAMQGDAVHLLTFTRGEAGSLGVSKELEPDELARLRTIELKVASEALGLSSQKIVGWPDSGLASMPFEDGVGVVGDALRLHEPDVLITFHREGVSRHPDHTTVYGWVMEAFARTDVKTVARVYGWGILEELCKPQRPERDMASIPQDEIAARIPLSEEAYQRKVESIHAHVTQITFFDRLKEWFGDYRSVNDAEYFELAASRVPQPQPVVDDLFAGLPA